MQIETVPIAKLKQGEILNRGYANSDSGSPAIELASPCGKFDGIASLEPVSRRLCRAPLSIFETN